VVVEDNSDAARLIQRILEARGSYEVHVAHDGIGRVSTHPRRRPDLVITDLMMPGVDGFSVIDTMKADPEMSRIPIVVVTAKELTAKERARLSGQINMLLQKGSFIDEEFVESLSVNWSKPGVGKTILYIEDDPASRLLVERTLRFAGYQVLVATCGWKVLIWPVRRNPI
jgi:CheY-like chemotaxis protein